MAITVVNVNVTTTAYTVPSGKYGKFIVNHAKIVSNAVIYIGDSQTWNGVGSTVYSFYVGGDADNASQLYLPGAQYIALQSNKYANTNVVAMLREHILVAGQTIYTDTSTSQVKGTMILQDV